MNQKGDKEFIQDTQGIFSKIATDHARHPRNVGNIPNCDGFGQGTGECGDTLGIWLTVKNDRIMLATFWTDGCGASIACGSMVTELASGRSVEEAKKITPDIILNALGGLPEDHIHCAKLAADTLAMAIKDYLETSKIPWKKAYLK